jgi:hypothetical protein
MRRERSSQHVSRQPAHHDAARPVCCNATLDRVLDAVRQFMLWHERRHVLTEHVEREPTCGVCLCSIDELGETDHATGTTLSVRP